MNRKAFTLIELAISLIVIGFIFSAIMTGNNIYKASRIRTIINEQRIYKTAIDNFKNTYNQIPGDMINATSILANNNQVVYSNGNGNGLVDTNSEYYLLPQHLMAAGFIKGYYDGQTELIQSVLIPNSWSYQSFNQNIFNIWQANDANILYYNKNNSLSDGSISPIDASNIDIKIDDGNASTGYVYAMSKSNLYSCIRTSNGTGSTVNSTYTGTDANYDLTTKSNECELLFGNFK